MEENSSKKERLLFNNFNQASKGEKNFKKTHCSDFLKNLTLKMWKKMHSILEQSKKSCPLIK